MSNNSNKSIQKPNIESIHSKLEFLRLRLNSQFPDVKVMAMVSSRQKEGKTFILDQFAVSLTNAGYKTLVINGNMLEESNKNTSEEGNLTQYLKGDSPKIKTMKAKKEYDLLNCVYEPKDSSRLLESNKYSSLIQEQRDHYDYILIDTPAFEKGIDGFLIGKQSDGVIYVVESDYNNEEDLLEYRKILEEAKVVILGAILNKHTHNF